MATEIYIYNSIDEYTAESVNRQFTWAENEDVNIRTMTRGGYTPAGIAMLAKISAHTGNVKMSVDGDTSSMGAFMLLFADEVEMSDMAELMFHKAAYPSYYTPTPEQKENLDRENANFKKKMVQRLGEAGSELVSQVFDSEKRTDVFLTAAKAKKIGLVTKIIKLEPSQKAAFQESYHKQMLGDKKKPTPEIKDKPQINPEKKRNMEITQFELDSKLASAKAEGVKEGVVLGVAQEHERVEAWAEIGEVDAKTAFEGINGTAEVSKKVMVATMLKQGANDQNIAHQADNLPDAETPPEAKTAEVLRKEKVDAEFLKIEEGE